MRVNVPREDRPAKAVEPVSLETLLNIETPDALAVDLTVSDTPPAGDNLLASLLAQPGSGLTEGMRGITPAVARASDVATKVNDVPPDETLTELLSQGMRDGRVDATDVARVSGGDQSTHDALLAMLADESVVVQPLPSAHEVSVSHATHLQDFPMTGAHTPVDVAQVVRDLGLTSGELHEAAQHLPVDAPAVPVAPEPVTPKAVEAPPAVTDIPVIAVTGVAATDNLAMDGYLRAIQDDPENGVLRLSVARVAVQCRMYEIALIQYRHLIRTSTLLEDVTTDLRDLLADIGEPQLRRDCSRLLGNAYARQSKVQEAVEAYRMTLNSGPTPLL